MSKVRVELNSAGVREMLKWDSVRDVIEGHGANAATAAGSGYEFSTHYSEQRVIVNVFAATAEAARDNYKNNTLLKTVGSS